MFLDKVVFLCYITKCILYFYVNLCIFSINVIKVRFGFFFGQTTISGGFLDQLSGNIKNFLINFDIIIK